MSQTGHIFVVDDEAAAREMVGDYLKMHGFEVTLCDGGGELRDALKRGKPDLVVLDLNMPQEDGLSLIRHLRHEGHLPIIMLTATASPIDRIVGLELGADDYLAKPFSIRELVARINAVLRRKKRYEKEVEVYVFGDVEVDFTARTIARDGEQLELSPRAFDLLAYFVRHPNEVVDRKQILNKVWGYDYYGTARTIDNFVTKLRQALEPDAANPRHFVTARGIGYKFVP
jgi:two-component system OmpR family response regulator